MKRVLLSVIFLLAASPLLLAGNLQKKANKVFQPLPLAAPVLKGNPATPVKIKLGKMLFLDPRLSKSQLISCNSCHNLGLGGADLQKTSVGHGWQKGPRNAPTVLNSVYHVAQFWDGRSPDLQAQAKGPVQAGVEMNNKPKNVVATLRSMPGYVKLFKKAFPKSKKPVTFDNMAKAIAVFEATLNTPSRFDQYLNGNKKALKKDEIAGLKLFMDKGCSSCHSGVNVGGGIYAKFGVASAPHNSIRPKGDLGRFAVTQKKEDKYSFRVPTLRNIALTAPYFHSGAVQDLGKAVNIMGKTQLGVKFKPAETKAIVAFLKSLTGKQPEVTYPILPASTKSTPLPAP